MISSTASRCLTLIGVLQYHGHRKPNGLSDEDWYQAAKELSAHVVRMDHLGNENQLECLLLGLQEEWACYRGEQAVIQMGLATRGLLDG